MDKNEKIMNTLREYKKELEEKGYNVIYIGLYGSQNYNLDDEQSDIDARAIVIPKLREIIERKTISKDYEFETGKVDVKDLYTYYGVIKKGNFSFIEPFQTKWYIGDETLRTLFSKFKVNYKALAGTMCQKYKNVVKEDESGNIIEYNPKELHHLYRLWHLYHLIDGNNENYSFFAYDDGAKGILLMLKREKIEDFNSNEFKERMGCACMCLHDAQNKIIKKEQNIEQPQLDDWIVDRIISEVKEECLWMKDEK